MSETRPDPLAWKLPWEQMMAQVYRRQIEYMLRPNPLMEAWQREAAERWANQTRWYRARFRSRRWLRKTRDNIRYRIANAIYPYPESDY